MCACALTNKTKEILSKNYELIERKYVRRATAWIGLLRCSPIHLMRAYMYFLAFASPYVDNTISATKTISVFILFYCYSAVLSICPSLSLSFFSIKLHMTQSEYSWIAGTLYAYAHVRPGTNLFSNATVNVWVCTVLTQMQCAHTRHIEHRSHYERKKRQCELRLDFIVFLYNSTPLQLSLCYKREHLITTQRSINLKIASIKSFDPNLRDRNLSWNRSPHDPVQFEQTPLRMRTIRGSSFFSTDIYSWCTRFHSMHTMHFDLADRIRRYSPDIVHAELPHVYQANSPDNHGWIRQIRRTHHRCDTIRHSRCTGWPPMQPYTVNLA